jgi:hypothetical protein
MANGDTMPMPMLGSKNSTPAARNGPDFSPKPERSNASHTGSAITGMKNIQAATARTIELSSTREGLRSETRPPM